MFRKSHNAQENEQQSDSADREKIRTRMPSSFWLGLAACLTSMCWLVGAIWALIGLLTGNLPLLMLSFVLLGGWLVLVIFGLKKSDAHRNAVKQYDAYSMQTVGTKYPYIPSTNKKGEVVYLSRWSGMALCIAGFVLPIGLLMFGSVIEDTPVGDILKGETPYIGRMNLPAEDDFPADKQKEYEEQQRQKEAEEYRSNKSTPYNKKIADFVSVQLENYDDVAERNGEQSLFVAPGTDPSEHIYAYTGYPVRPHLIITRKDTGEDITKSDKIHWLRNHFKIPGRSYVYIAVNGDKQIFKTNGSAVGEDITVTGSMEWPYTIRNVSDITSRFSEYDDRFSELTDDDEMNGPDAIAEVNGRGIVGCDLYANYVANMTTEDGRFDIANPENENFTASAWRAVAHNSKENIIWIIEVNKYGVVAVPVSSDNSGAGHEMLFAESDTVVRFAPSTNGFFTSTLQDYRDNGVDARLVNTPDHRITADYLASITRTDLGWE